MNFSSEIHVLATIVLKPSRSAVKRGALSAHSSFASISAERRSSTSRLLNNFVNVKVCTEVYEHNCLIRAFMPCTHITQVFETACT